MNFIAELKRLTRPYDDEDEELEDYEPAPKQEKHRERSERPIREEMDDSIFDTQSARRSNKVVNIHTTTQLQVVLVKPEQFESAPEIADHLREKRTVVLNLESVSKDVARRLLDFVAGVAYASEGKVKKVAAFTYIVTPFNVDILGDLVGELENNGLYNF